ncbi:BadF/BadG/BcrA/BcrD ATPase family protein [Microbacterium awajiense]|uniref:BadF/BadG/BcrA/BcrD ATPase family protein n=1 Tax=Microbacterium awajiense TaxID=415214 RepID=A0ABP7AVJ8_9MICO
MIAEQRRAGTTLALDAGQTAIKVHLTRSGGDTIQNVFPGIRTSQRLLPQLAGVVAAVGAELSDPIDVVTLGVSGLAESDADAAELLALFPSTRVREVHLAHDSVTSFLGALGDRRGAVIASGTGVVTLGVGAARVARVDGWGNIMGDAGSGYWIGRRGLESAMRSYDGREAPTALVDVVRSRWPDLENAYVDLQSDPDRVRVVASLAEAVTQLAPTDAVAAQITLHAARELAHSVITALRRVSDAEDHHEEVVAAIGGVFRSDSVRRRFEELVTEARPNARIEPAHGTALDGARSLSALAEQHPLKAHVFVAAT